MLAEVRRSSNRGPFYYDSMRQPSITDYIRTFENPTGVFRTLDDIEVEKDVYGEVELRAGNSAAVFTYLRSGQRRMLKCYARPNPRLREIYAYIEQNRPVLLPEVRLLPDELYVHLLSGEAGWVDVVEGEWIGGVTLDAVVARAAKTGDRLCLGSLADAFDDFCRTLLEQEWSHGDLKPENIVVRADGPFALIDCDAMWIPDFVGQRAAELGTPGYRHPGRDSSHFDKCIDDYPALLISASLHALALQPGLYAKYNTTDDLILLPEEILAESSAAFAEILGLFAQAGMACQYRMAEALASTFPEVENAGRYFAQPPAAPSGPLTSFVEKGGWGFADGGKTPVIAPFWDEVIEFRGSRAAVRLGRWWHFIDRAGNICESGLGHDAMKERLFSAGT